MPIVKSVQLVGLQLENFKVHEHLECQFSPTLTSIVGPNYSGKTTIEKGIFFALIGSAAVAGTKDDLTRHGAKKCSVVLDMTRGEEKIRVSRTASTASLEINGSLVASGHTSVTQAVAGIFGTDPKTLLALARSPMGETSSLLTGGAAKLNSLIEEAYNVKDVDFLIERAGAISKDAQLLRTAYPDSLDPEPLQLEIAELSRALEKILASLDRLSKEVDHLKGHKEALDKTIQEALEHNLKVSRAGEIISKSLKELELSEESQAEISQRILNSPTRDLHTLQQMQNYFTELEDSSNEIIKKSLELKLYQRDLEAKKDSLTKESRENLQSQLDRSFEQSALYKLELDACRQEKEKLSNQCFLKQCELDQLSKAKDSSICPSCKRLLDSCTDLEEVNRKIKEIYADWSSLREELEHCATEVVKKEALHTNQMLSTSTYGSKLKSYDSVELSLRALEKEIFQISGKFKVLSLQEEQDIRSHLKEERAKVTDYALALDKQNDLLSSLARLEARISELKTLTESQLEPKKDVSQDQDNVLRVARLLNDKNLELLSLKFQRDAASKEWTQKDLQLTKLKEDLSKMEALEKRAGRFKEVQACLRKNKSNFLNTYWETLLALASEFVSKATGGAVSELARAENGDFLFREKDALVSVDGCASGAQQAIFGVALRVALSELLPMALGFLVLDEPGSACDEEHSFDMVAALKTSSKQVVLITHKQDDEHISDSVIVLERKK